MKIIRLGGGSRKRKTFGSWLAWIIEREWEQEWEWEGEGRKREK